MRHWLDEVELVHVAATATGRSPDEVLASTDIAALAHVVARLEAVPTAVEAAATALLEIGRQRPFGEGSAATAWLATAHLLSLGGLQLRIGPIGAAGVLSPDLSLEVADVVEVLREHGRPRPSRWGRVVQALFVASRPDGPSVVPCPACGLPVVCRRCDIIAAGPWSASADVERVARCAVERRGHDRWAHRQPVRA